MRRSSIFSFETLCLDRRSWMRGSFVLAITLGVVCTGEALLRLDSAPKSLPFQNTRVGTIMDVLSRVDAHVPAVVFLGSSQCAYNISPNDVWESWGLDEPVSAINVGMPGCNIRTVNEFYAAFQSDLAGPLTVFVCAPLGMNGPIVADSIKTPGGDYLLHQLPGPEQQLMGLYLFRYRRQYRDLRYQYYLFTKHRAEADLVRRLGPNRCGWRPGQGAFLASTDSNLATGEHSRKNRITISDDPIVWQSLSETISTAQSRGSRVICLVPPQPPRFDDTIEQADEMWTRFITRLSEVCEARRVLFLDHHRLDEFGDACFFDYTHFKNADAVRYSRYLGEHFAQFLGPDIPQAG